jgi:hypothetical protein
MLGKSLDDVSNISKDLRISNGLSRRMMVLLAVKWWIAVSFPVHPDMRSHTGEPCHSEKGPYTQCPENNASILRALLKWNWFVWMIECHWSCSSGLTIFSGSAGS